MRSFELLVFFLFLLPQCFFGFLEFPLFVGEEVFEIYACFFENREVFIEFVDQKIDDFLGFVDQGFLIAVVFAPAQRGAGDTVEQFSRRMLFLVEKILVDYGDFKDRNLQAADQNLDRRR